MREYTVRLPLPSSDLCPHAKGHWRTKAKATKTAREAAWVLCLKATASVRPMLARSEVSISYDISGPMSTKGYRARDTQNALAACKAYIDGCKDAGLIVDDSAKHLSWGRCEIVTLGAPGVTLTFREVLQ